MEVCKMKKFTKLIVAVCMMMTIAGTAFADLRLEKSGRDILTIYNSMNNQIGTIKISEIGNYKVYNEDGKYLGLIHRKSGKWIDRKAHETPSSMRQDPETLRFYLNVLDALRANGFLK
jgi:hypothetical protein